MPTCLVHNCEAAWRFRLSDLAFTFVSWSNLLIPIIVIRPWLIVVVVPLDVHNINALAFHNDCGMNFIINIYSDSDQTALRFLSQNIINLNNIIIMTNDFNIRDSDWDPNFRHYSIHTKDLITIANSLGCKGTPNTPLRSLFQSSRVTLKPIQYYYIILGLTPIIPRALCCHLAHFSCSDPGYWCRDAKTL